MEKKIGFFTMNFITSLQERCNQATQLFQQQRYAEAITLYRVIIEEIAHCSTADASMQQELIALQIRTYNNKSQCHLNQNNFVEAKASAQMVLQLDPSNSKAWFRVYKSQLSLHQYWSALRSISKMEHLCQTKMQQEKLALWKLLQCFDVYTCFEMIFQYITSPYFGQHYSKQCIEIQDKTYHSTWQIQEISNATTAPYFASTKVLEQYHAKYSKDLLPVSNICNEFADFQQELWDPNDFQQLDRIMYHIFAQGMKRSKGFVTLLLMRLILKFTFGGENTPASTLPPPSVQDKDTEYEMEMHQKTTQLRSQFPHYKRVAVLLNTQFQWEIVEECNLLYVLTRVPRDITWFGIGKGGALIRDMDENFVLEFTLQNRVNQFFIVDLFPTMSGIPSHQKTSQLPFLLFKTESKTEQNEYLMNGKQYKLKQEWKCNNEKNLDAMLDYIHKQFIKESYLSQEVKQEFIQCCSHFDSMMTAFLK